MKLKKKSVCKVIVNLIPFSSRTIHLSSNNLFLKKFNWDHYFIFFPLGNLVGA
jgi:hypothetical protein